MFLSLFSGFNTNEVTKEAKSTFPNSAKNVFKLSSCVIYPLPQLCLSILAKHWRKLPQVPGKRLGNNTVVCSHSCISVSTLGLSSSCFSQYLLYKILQPSCPSDLLPNYGGTTISQIWLQTFDHTQRVVH